MTKTFLTLPGWKSSGLQERTILVEEEQEAARSIRATAASAGRRAPERSGALTGRSRSSRIPVLARLFIASPRPMRRGRGHSTPGRPSRGRAAAEAESNKGRIPGRMARTRASDARRRLVLYLPHPLPIWRLPGASLERIRRDARAFDIDLPQNETALGKLIPDAEVLFAWGLARGLVPRAEKLRWLPTPLAGVDRVLSPELLATSVRITSSRGVNSVSVAEHALALVLALTRGITASARAQKERRWVQTDLYGRRPPLSE